MYGIDEMLIECMTIDDLPVGFYVATLYKLRLITDDTTFDFDTCKTDDWLSTFKVS